MIVMFLADGFEETEAIAPFDMLKRAGCEIVTVGVGNKNEITSTHGVKITADIKDTELDTENVDGVILPGGMPGALNLEKSDIVRNTVLSCNKHGKLVSAICAAPYILGVLGLLKGKNAVCYPGFEDKLTGACVSGDGVCADGNIITAKGAGVAIEFGLQLVSFLFGKSISDEIRGNIQSR